MSDALGMRVDPEIEEAVVALRLLGFSTTMSCAGHNDRVTEGPYVMMRSNEAHREYLGGEAEPDEQVTAVRLARARALALAEADHLRALLADYYFRDRPSPQGREVIEVRMVGHYSFRLNFVHAEFDSLLDQTALRAVISARQIEMKRLTRYLIDRLDLQPGQTEAA